MAWEFDRYGVARYIQKVRIDGRVTSKILGTGEAGIAAERQVLLEREAKRQRRVEEREFRANLGIYQQTVRQITEQTFIWEGLIYRNSTWRRVSKLKKPLTPEERAYIKRIKRMPTVPPTDVISNP
jgi:hypothetical protein